MDQLFNQFTDYQSLQDDSVDDSQRIDQIWHHLGVLQSCDGLRFNLLFEVVKYILLLPHSNAQERIFSIKLNSELAFQTRPHSHQS